MTLPDNDTSIDDEDTLLRRVPNRPRMVALRPDGRLRPSSAALELRDDEVGCSVDVREWLPEPDSPLSSLDGCPAGWGLAACLAEAPRRDDHHRVVGDKLDDNPAHALIVPTAETRAKQKRHFGKLAEAMTFIQAPDAQPQ